MKSKRWIALLLAFAMVLAMTACGGDDEKDAVVAKVGDTEITYGELSDFTALNLYAQGYSMDMFEGQDDYLKIMQQSMLSQMVSYEVMRQDLEAKGDEIFPDDYQESLDKFLESANGLETELGISKDTLTYYFKAGYYLKPFDEEAKKNVSDADIKEYYNSNIVNYTVTEPAIRASHILVADEKTANELYDRITAGEDFAALASEFGTDGTSLTGGDLGGFTKGQMVEAFSNAAFALENVGDVSKPVKSDYGYHIIKLTGRIESGTMPLDWEESSIRTTLSSTKLNDIISDLVSKMKVEYLGDFAPDADNSDNGDNGGNSGGESGE